MLSSPNRRSADHHNRAQDAIAETERGNPMRGQTIIGVRIHERETPLHSWRSRELLHEVHEDQYPEIVKSELVNIRLTEDNQPLVMIESFCEFYPYRETED